MTDADRLVLVDIILRHAFGRIPDKTRHTASFYRERDCPIGADSAKEALEAAQDTASAIEQRFDLFRAKTIRDL